MNAGRGATGWLRRVKAALLAGGILGLGGGALAESGLLPTLVGAGAGAGLGAALGALVPDRMLGRGSRDGQAGVARDDVRETRYWRGCMPVMSAVIAFLALSQVVMGRWFSGLLLSYSVIFGFVVPEWRYQRYLKHGGDPGPPMSARRFTVGGRTFGPGAVVGGSFVLATVVGLVIGVLLA
ncbi:hypothetical protein GCM10009801_00360 [Streptomyces albiaxialis]|uniref:Uncharacterized protein n=1 Tax=Streptomyces albiaxialis TaxID=329523 RepID=A0ABN2VD61_9ACTN